MSKRKASYECSRSSPRKQRNCHGDCLDLFSTESSSPIPDVFVHVVASYNNLLRRLREVRSHACHRHNSMVSPACNKFLHLMPVLINCWSRINAGSKTSRRK